MVPIVDVRLRFHFEEREHDERTCIVVIDINGTMVGLPVDTVSEVLDVPQGDIDPPPRIQQGESARYIRGMGKVDEKVKILLDAQKLLYEEALGQLAA